MEFVDLHTKYVAEAMFEKLGLPMPIYHVHRLEQGGCKAQIEFHHTEEHFRASVRWVKLSGRVCEDGQASMNHEADLAIEYMETREKKVLVYYKYYQLDQHKHAFAILSNRLLEELEKTNQHRQTIKKVTKETSEYLKEVCFASNRIHVLLVLPSALKSPCLFLISNKLFWRSMVEWLHFKTLQLQHVPRCRKKTYTLDNKVPDPVYNGLSDGETDEYNHQDMDEDFTHYVQSP
ncbi:hypothetical protein ZWY2020_051042 [Hordeum vulgare]|nr:hypothetical protein ZWY2020_051042 [Hordeum vulgare]